MDKKISVIKIINQLKTSDFLVGCEIPLGYVAGIPTVQIKNDTVCLVIPYLKYKITGAVDKTLVFPVRYLVCISLPDEKVVQFADLSEMRGASKIDFSKPVGLFRHDSIKSYTRQEYDSKRKELMMCYDVLLSSLIYGTEFSVAEQNKMKELLRLLVEPSLIPFYKSIDPDFYKKYLFSEV